MVSLHNCNKTKSHTYQVDNPQTGKYLYQKSSPTEVKVAKTTLTSETTCEFGGPQDNPQVTRAPGSLAWEEKELLEHLALKASRVKSQEFHRIGGNRNSALGGHTKVS